MIALLQKYLTINTAHPSPDYNSVITLFREQALNDGFDAKEIILPSGNPMLIITLPGYNTHLPALALNHHMDVVPANNSHEWIFTPFAGIIHENQIYGRGTQDCKGLGIVHYAALRRLKNSNLPVERTIHCIIVPDEECGGFHGTGEFIEHPFFSLLNIGYVLDEGLPSGSSRELLIKTDERTPLQIQVISIGKQSHSSGIFHNNCLHTLLGFLTDIVSFHTKQKQSAHRENAGTYISAHITGITTDSSSINSIPSQAVATIDIRIPPHLSLSDGQALLDTFIKKHPAISYEILATSKQRTKPMSQDSNFYQTLERVVRSHHLIPRPFIFEATTDARFYSQKNIEVLGFTPFFCAPNLHGTDESININDLQHGCTLLYDFLVTFCSK